MLVFPRGYNPLYVPAVANSSFSDGFTEAVFGAIFVLAFLASSTMPAATRSSVSEAVHDTVPAIFQQAQHSVASHKKNVVQLHKIQLQAAAYTEPTPKGPRLVGERTFNNQFLDVLKNILPSKKGITVADRIVKFVGAFIRFILEKGW